MSSGIIQLVPELQQLFDDFVAMRERFGNLGEAYVQQKIRLETQQTELQEITKQLTASKRRQNEDERIAKAYDQLKLDYELLNSATENHREEIYNENKKRVRDLETELQAARDKASEQSELHRASVARIVAEYEAKLRDADEKIRQLNNSRNETPGANAMENTADMSQKLITSAKPQRGANKRWPRLNIEIATRGLSSRGRGRSRGAGTRKRKLYTDNEIPIDVE